MYLYSFQPKGKMYSTLMKVDLNEVNEVNEVEHNFTIIQLIKYSDSAVHHLGTVFFFERDWLVVENTIF